MGFEAVDTKKMAEAIRLVTQEHWTKKRAAAHVGYCTDTVTKYMKAAGIQYKRPKNLDINAEKIRKLLELPAQEESPISTPIHTPKIPSGNIVLVIPDLHCPWEHQDALAFLIAVREKYRPNVFVNLGDEVDFYGMSRFSHAPDMPSAGTELSDAVKHLIPFYKEFPHMLVCHSNHTHRIDKKASEAYIPKAALRRIEEILKTPEGWVYKACHQIDGVDYKHGTGKSGAQAHINHAKATGRSTCIGHIHAFAGVNYLRPNMFAANFACLIDKRGGCFDYTSEMDDNIVLGCGVVINGTKAFFIPMETDENGRWTGKL